MTILLKGGRIFLGRKFVTADVLLKGGSAFVFDKGAAPDEMTALCSAAPDIENAGCGDVFGTDTDAEVIDLSGKDILPGFADVHVHFREPGFSYKETIRTGSLAAAHGGYTCVCPMPNIVPVPKDLDSLRAELDIINKTSLLDVIPYGAITVKQDGRSELSDMESMAPYVCAFSDDGRGIQTGDLMRDAMQLAGSLGKLIVAHCEDESLLQPGGCVHEGLFAEASGLIGISSASEWRQVERDVNLCYETGCAYHVCHVSTKESVQIIREAKQSGVNVTCETAPHYLTLTQDDVAEYCRGGEPADSGRFKMNPPLRGKDDREALREGVFDGTIDMIATDHAPHSAEEKARGLEKSPFGITGLETSFPILKTRLVETGILTYERLIECLASAPRKRFGLPGAETLDHGSFRAVYSEDAGGGCEGNVGYKEAVRGNRMIFPDLTIIDPEYEYTIDPDDFLSMGHATPFEGDTVRGKVIMTIHKGKIAYEGCDNDPRAQDRN
ncbi:MAG: dihydroorotase [Eubacterium sp.]|nr:dihydroorotase [Eubacterium sp.]